MICWRIGAIIIIGFWGIMPGGGRGAIAMVGCWGGGGFGFTDGGSAGVGPDFNVTTELVLLIEGGCFKVTLSLMT